MKKKLILLFLTGCLLFSACSPAPTQTPDIQNTDEPLVIPIATQTSVVQNTDEPLVVPNICVVDAVDKARVTHGVGTPDPVGSPIAPRFYDPATNQANFSVVNIVSGGDTVVFWNMTGNCDTSQPLNFNLFTPNGQSVGLGQYNPATGTWSTTFSEVSSNSSYLLELPGTDGNNARVLVSHGSFNAPNDVSLNSAGNSNGNLQLIFQAKSSIFPPGFAYYATATGDTSSSTSQSCSPRPQIGNTYYLACNFNGYPQNGNYIARLFASVFGYDLGMNLTQTDEQLNGNMEFKLTNITGGSGSNPNENGDDNSNGNNNNGGDDPDCPPGYIWDGFQCIDDGNH